MVAISHRCCRVRVPLGDSLATPGTGRSVDIDWWVEVLSQEKATRCGPIQPVPELSPADGSARGQNSELCSSI